MSRLRAALRNLFGGRRIDRDTKAELRAYLGFAADERERQGLGRSDAERVARAEFGSLASVHDSVRDVQAGQRLSTLWRDLTYGLRVLKHSRAFAVAVIAVLALGIGANTAVFSIVSGVLLRPIPLPDGSRLVRLFHTPPPASFPGVTRFSVSPANYLDWKADNTVFEDTAVYGLSGMTLTGGERAESLVVARVEPSLFPILRVQPMSGRLFLPDENQPGRGQVAIVSLGFWKSHFGDASLAGQTLTLERERYTVVGIMPANFSWSAWSITDAPVWVPLVWSNEDRAVRSNHNYQVVARLKPNVTVAQAAANMDEVSRRLALAYPKENTGWGATVLTLRELIVGDIRRSLVVLLGAVGFVLLIASANAANLLLTRALGRRKELAIRAALGASRGRVVQQVLVEALLIGVAAGVLGAALARVGLSVFGKVLAEQVPRATDIAFDGLVLAFTMAAALSTAVAAGLGPALSASRTTLHDTLKQGVGRTAAMGSGRLGRRLLVGAEVALSLVLLVGAGLMIRSMSALSRIDPGFDPSNLLTMTVSIPTTKYPTAASQSQFFDDSLARMRALPGVTSAAFVDSVPFTGGSMQPFAIVGRAVPATADQLEVAVRDASPGYLTTMRIPLVRGRDVDPHDPHVVLVSQAAVRAFWPTSDPIGQRMTFLFSPGITWDVVGVVGDVKLNGLDSPVTAAAVYQWQAVRPWTFGVFVVRTSGPPATMAAPVEHVIHAIDPDQAVRRVSTMDETLAATTSTRRFEEQLLSLFALVALVLAATGLYSVLAYVVRGRAREIAVRSALGASAASVIGMVLREGATPTAGGLAVGLGGALLLGPVLNTLVFGVGTFDPLTLVGAATVIASVATAAGLAPAYRACRLDPVKVLRED